MPAVDIVVVGGGVVGAACALECAAAGLSATVVDRGAVASGTTGAGEGNLLVSDKEPGPELGDPGRPQSAAPGVPADRADRRGRRPGGVPRRRPRLPPRHAGAGQQYPAGEIVSSLRSQTRLLGLPPLVAQKALGSSAREHRTLLGLVAKG